MSDKPITSIDGREFYVKVIEVKEGGECHHEFHITPEKFFNLFVKPYLTKKPVTKHTEADRLTNRVDY